MSTDVWDSVDTRNSLGDHLADDLRSMVRRFEQGAERSQQRHLGPSQIGDPCTRCLARHVLGVSVEREFDDPWCRILGTAGHSWLEGAAAWDNLQTLNGDDDAKARWHPEQHVQPHPDLLPSGGKADLYDEQTATVIDHKIIAPARIKAIKLNGPGDKYRGQGHLYGLGLHRRGLEVKNVALALWPRGGRLSDLFVWTEPYDGDYAMSVLARYRTIRDKALAIGLAILPLLPADPDCWNCGGKDVEVTSPNPAPAA